MDSHGWIPVKVLASFNRVRSLTLDEHLVKDVLTLSSLTEVRGNWVRLHRWQPWIYPNASESVVEPSGDAEGESSTAGAEYAGDGASRSHSYEATAELAPQDPEGYPHPQHYSEARYVHGPEGFYPQAFAYPGNYNATAHASEGLDASVRIDNPGVPGEHLHMHATPRIGDPLSEQGGDEDESDELESEESDVEIVLGQDANGSWTPERKQG